MIKSIKAKALCMFNHQDKYLLSRNYDPTKQEYFLRPIGGSIEFGETSLQAIQREILEEIKAEITEIELVKVYENLFCFDGKAGHEIIFMYQAKFVDSSFYQHAVLEAYESDGVALDVRWFTEQELKQYPIYPLGIDEFFQFDKA